MGFMVPTARPNDVGAFHEPKTGFSYEPEMLAMNLFRRSEPGLYVGRRVDVRARARARARVSCLVLDKSNVDIIRARGTSTSMGKEAVRFQPGSVHRPNARRKTWRLPTNLGSLGLGLGGQSRWRDPDPSGEPLFRWIIQCTARGYARPPGTDSGVQCGNPSGNSFPEPTFRRLRLTWRCICARAGRSRCC